MSDLKDKRKLASFITGKMINLSLPIKEIDKIIKKYKAEKWAVEKWGMIYAIHRIEKLRNEKLQGV